MPKTKRTILDLSELPPEHDHIRDEDGQLYELRPMSDFSAAESARLAHIQSRYQNAHKLLRRGKRKQAEAQLEQASVELLRMIVPEMPTERIRAMTMGKRGLIYDFWSRKEDERREAIGITRDDALPDLEDEEGE